MNKILVTRVLQTKQYVIELCLVKINLTAKILFFVLVEQ